MKIFYIKSVDDYDALRFEEDFRGMYPDIDIWGQLKDNNGIIEQGEFYFEGEALEFGEIDPKFIQFVKNEICDYDSLKHRNFYLVEE